MVANYPLSWLVHRCTPLILNPGGCAFLSDLPLWWAPDGWPCWSPISCDNPLAMTRNQCFSGVRLTDLGSRRNQLFSSIDLEPDGCLVADQLKLHAKHLKNRVQMNKRGCIRTGWWPCKKTVFFLRWTDVFYWQGPFNGCQYLESRQITDIIYDQGVSS